MLYPTTKKIATKTPEQKAWYKASEKARQVRLAEDRRLTKKMIERKLTKLEVIWEILYGIEKTVEDFKKEK